MKLQIILGALIAVGVCAVSASADTFVRGYMRSDGTYVAPHWRSAPDGSYNNNWSTSPNTNPYTGSVGSNPPLLFDVPPPRNPYSGYRGSRY